MREALKFLDLLALLFKMSMKKDLENRNLSLKMLCVVLLFGWGIMSFGYMFATGIMQFFSVIIEGGLKTPVLYLFSFVFLFSSFFVRYHSSVIKYLSKFSLFSEPITLVVGGFHNALFFRMFGFSFLFGMVLSFSGFAGINDHVNAATYQFYILASGLVSIGFFAASAILYFVATMVPIFILVRLSYKNRNLL